MAAGESAELEERPAPAETRCPECGAPPTEESKRDRHLSNLGYLHQDVRLRCSADDCDGLWVAGMPIGEFDRPDLAEDLRCDACESDLPMLVHRVRMRGVGGHDIGIDLKCPNPECYRFEQVGRDLDKEGVALVGYPEITGQTEGADPYGWSDGDGGPE